MVPMISRIEPTRAVVILLLFMSSCGGTGGPTASSSASPSPSTFDFSGVWEGTMVETLGAQRTLAMTVSLTQAAGSTTLQGTVTTSYVTATEVGGYWETITSGSVDGRALSFQTVHSGANGPSYDYHYQGMADSTGTTLSGTIRIGDATAASAIFTVHRQN
jgi:hypothetical protein